MVSGQPLVRSLRCVCSNSGIAVYLMEATTQKLADLVGDFRRGDGGDDPPIYCKLCGAEVGVES